MISPPTWFIMHHLATLGYLHQVISNHVTSRVWHITSMILWCVTSAINYLIAESLTRLLFIYSSSSFGRTVTHTFRVHSCCTLPSSLAFTLAHACLVTPSCMCALFPFTSFNPPLFVSLTHPFYFLTYTINVITVRVFPSNLSGWH